MDRPAWQRLSNSASALSPPTTSSVEGLGGQIVRHVTTQTKLEACAEDEPNCCGDAGCCDSRSVKLFIIISVAVLASLLFLSFLGVCLYSAFMVKKKNKPSALEPKDRTVVPRYNIDTYLTIAGYGPDVLKADGPTSAVKPKEHHADDSSDELEEDDDIFEVVDVSSSDEDLPEESLV